MDGGEPFAGRAGSSRSHDLIVASNLVALLVAAVSTHLSMADEIGDTSVDRQSYVAFVIGLVATLSLSIARMWPLLSSDPRADDEGARS
ncbi:hypothetical protein SAMN05444161_8440 [Rhizobiales bacterium GAS191]|nr:hypothetical protein SAMN05444161_8440 [Rhizobiales bacterium GAS191]